MASAKHLNDCNSGRGDCLNPEPSLRPTDLSKESRDSIESGYCSYCRRAGLGVKDAFYSSSPGISITPPEEDDFNTDDFPNTFNQSAYDNFDPDTYDPDKIISSATDTNESNIPSESLDEEDYRDYEDQKEYFDLSELVANEKMKAFDASKEETSAVVQDEESPENKKSRGRPKKAVLELVEDDKPKRKRGRPARPMEEIDLPETKRPQSFKEAFAAKLEQENISQKTSESLNEEPLRPENSKEPLLPESNKQPEAPVFAKAERNKTSDILSKMPPKPSEIVISSVFAKNEASVSQTQTAKIVAVSRISFFSRILVGLKEFSLGLMDVATSSGRITASLIQLILFILVSIISLIFLIFRPIKFVKHIITSCQAIVSLFKSAFKPFFDGRLIPSLGFLVACVGLSLSQVASEANSIILLATGCGTALGWAAWRGARGLITGNTLEKIVKKWERNWIDTNEMNSKQIHKLNNEFEEVVADVFEEMGFTTKLNGTQAARQNGHVGSGDGGADVFLYDSHKRLSVVSCKRYSNPVGVKEVRDIFAVSQGADFKGSRPILVTTIGFSQPAIDFAKKNGILLLKFNDIMNQAKRFSS